MYGSVHDVWVIDDWASNYLKCLHVNMEKLVGANYTSLIGMKRVSKIKGFGTEDADALAQQNANERLSFARDAICGS